MVDSTPGKGSTFYIYLPVSANSTSSKEESMEQPDNSIDGSVLVMDDEEAIRNILSQYLQQLGCTVTTASDGEEALGLFRENMNNEEGFDLVILDLTVPAGMGGIECLQHLKKIEPGVRAIVTSGYSDNPVMADFKRYGFSGALPKPVNFKSLKAAVTKSM